MTETERDAQRGARSATASWYQRQDGEDGDRVAGRAATPIRSTASRSPAPRRSRRGTSTGAKAGDTVRIMETRPLAKTVRWRVAEIVERAK